MKKMLLLVAAFVVCIILATCTTATPTIIVYHAFVEFSVSAEIPTSGVEGAVVKAILNGLTVGETQTDLDGHCLVELTWEGLGPLVFPEFVISKNGFSSAYLKGLEVNGDSEVIPQLALLINKENIGLHRERCFPDILIMTADKSSPIDLENCSEDTVLFEISYNEKWNRLWLAPEYIPWEYAHCGFSEYENHTEILLPLKGLEGRIPLFVVMTDALNRRYYQIFYVNRIGIQEELLEYLKPENLFSSCWTLPTNFSRFSDERDTKSDCAVIIKIEWEQPGYLDPIAGWKLYRSLEGAEGNYELISFIPPLSEVRVGYDASTKIKPGTKVWYKVVTIFEDGTESDPSETIEITPLDLFGVSLITPNDKAVEISRTPTFNWKPIKPEGDRLSDVGCGIVPEASITFHYSFKIFDKLHHNFKCLYPSLSDPGYSLGGTPLDVKTIADQVLLLSFLEPTWTDIENNIESPLYWIERDDSGKALLYEGTGLETYKSYEWGIDSAYAEYHTENTEVRSISIDPSGLYSEWIVSGYKLNQFTTTK